MATHKIPATVAILTRNSGKSLSRALESVRDFEEVLVCDGGSSDDTLAMAQSFQARILAQDLSALNSDGRLANWSVVRNQCLKASRYAWHVVLDSDEELGEGGLEYIRGVVREGVPGAYMVDRKYRIGTDMIECSIAYPNRQMRFFHKDAVTSFRKPVHERIDVRKGVTPALLGGYIIVPVDEDAVARKRKRQRYIGMELSRFNPMTARQVLRMGLVVVRVTVLYMIRLFRPCTGKRMPLAIEYESIAYLWALLLRASLRIRSL